MTRANFQELVGRIYEAAGNPDLWPGVLHDLAQTGDAIAGAMLATRTDRWMGWCCSPGTPAGLDDYLRSDAVTRSEITTRLVLANRAGFVPDQDVMTDEAWLADPVMTEYATRAGLHHAAATAINLPTGDLVVVHLHRQTGLPKFSTGDLARLDVYRPHLARAALLAVRWRLERLRAAAEALGLVGLPALVVDIGGRVLAANDLIQTTSPWIAWRPGDHIALVDTAANKLLQGALAELREPVSGSVRSIPIKATTGKGAAVVHVIPTIGQARDVFLGAFGIVVITPVAASSPHGGNILRALFDLTPAEARVAQAIAEGTTLEQLAARHSVTVETVRAQAKAAFSKTGAHSQAQLAALLGGISRLPCSSSRSASAETKAFSERG